jgi:biopolymer transport protein TolQ
MILPGIFLHPLLAEGGLVFAFTKSTVPGKLILVALFLASILAWSVMITKFRILRRANEQNRLFHEAFRADRQPLRIYQSGARYDAAPLFKIYRAGCDELAFHLLGSTEVDETFSSRLEIADPITPAQMRAVQAAMERAVGETALRLESQMIVLATAVSGAPFLGLLGTVWGVMDAFSGVAQAGQASMAAMAPGVSGSLITTVIGLLVAIPSMFGYNYLLTNLRGADGQLRGGTGLGN